MAVTAAQLDALKAAYYSGELTVESGGERITYQNAKDLERAIAKAEAEYQAGQGNKRVRVVRFNTAKGF